MCIRDRYSLANHTSSGEREHFLPAAPEDKGVPALEPHDYVALSLIHI